MAPWSCAVLLATWLMLAFCQPCPPNQFWNSLSEICDDCPPICLQPEAAGSDGDKQVCQNHRKNGFCLLPTTASTSAVSITSPGDKLNTSHVPTFNKALMLELVAVLCVLLLISVGVSVWILVKRRRGGRGERRRGGSPTHPDGQALLFHQPPAIDSTKNGSSQPPEQADHQDPGPVQHSNVGGDPNTGGVALTYLPIIPLNDHEQA